MGLLGLGGSERQKREAEESEQQARKQLRILKAMTQQEKAQPLRLPAATKQRIAQAAMVRQGERAGKMSFHCFYTTSPIRKTNAGV